MDDETKDFSELNLEDTTINEEEKTIEIDNDNLISVNEQIKEIKKEEINEKIEELKSEQDNNKRLNKTLIILIVILSIVIISFFLYLLFFKKDNKPDNKEEALIVRPGDDIEYIILKQNEITLTCNKTNNGEKITTLKQGLIIECDLSINTSENINELYFDLDNSNNLKLKEYKNDSDFTLINDNKTYKLTSTTPFNTLTDKIKFYYEVTDISEKTGYSEIKNIVFKDNENKYYKMINSIFAFPPEYNDKIFIYKQTTTEGEAYYTGSKIKLNNEETLELVDTFKCKSEECEIKDNHSNYFIIYDEGFIVYDVAQRTKQTVNIKEDKFDYTKYEYELITNKKNEVLGILLKSNYKDNSNCNIKENYCIEESISGYDVSYYSLSKNMFTVAFDYGFRGANIYNDYDAGLMLYKDNKYGVFSYEDDDMVVPMSKNYTSIEYKADASLVKIGVYDNKKKQNYYKYYNIDNNSFVLDVKNYSFEKFNSSKNILTIKEVNKQGNTIYMLFNLNGEAFTELPYTTPNEVEIITDKTIVIKNKDVYDIYDLNGNFIETSSYIQTGLDILKTTNSYMLALDMDDGLIVTNSKGKTLHTLFPTNDINEIYDIDTMNIVKCEEKNSELEIIITNYNITEEGKNAYKFRIDSSNKLYFEYIDYDENEE